MTGMITAKWIACWEVETSRYVIGGDCNVEWNGLITLLPNCSTYLQCEAHKNNYFLIENALTCIVFNILTCLQ